MKPAVSPFSVDCACRATTETVSPHPAATLRGIWVASIALFLMLGLGLPSAFAQSSDHSWNGAYAGFSAGAKIGHSIWTTTSVTDRGDVYDTTVDASSPAKFRPVGPRISEYGGYNWQFGHWVFGPEADAGWSTGTSNKIGLPGCTINCSDEPGPGLDTSFVRYRWDVSMRVRLGYLARPGLLVYETMGAASQNLEVSGTCQASPTDPQCMVMPKQPLRIDTHSHTRAGWTVGGGVEGRVASRWLVRAEYRYADFGSTTDAFFVGKPELVPGLDTYRFGFTVRAQVVTAGIAYKF